MSIDLHLQDTVHHHNPLSQIACKGRGGELHKGCSRNPEAKVRQSVVCKHPLACKPQLLPNALYGEITEGFMSELVMMSVPIDFLEKNVSNKLFISYN